MRLDFLTVINIDNMVSEDVMPGRSVGRYQLFGRKCYIYLQDTSVVPNTLIRRRPLGPRKKFHTNRKQITSFPEHISVFHVFRQKEKERQG